MESKSMQLIKSFFEDLANEILYEIFEYLDLYHVYDVFFYLNQRFQTLLLNSTIPIKINIPTVFKSNVEGYYEKMIIRNKHRINIIRLSNPFIVDIIFSPTHVISKFIRLEILILDNIHTKNLHEIFLELMCLPNLHSMVLHPAEYVQSSIDIFSEIFLLSTLKYFKLTYQMRIYEDSLSSYSWQYGHSTIEHLTINTCFPDSLLIDLLVCFPNLRRLSINYLTHSHFDDTKLRISQSSKDLKCVTLKLDLITFNIFEKIIQNFFYYVEILQIVTQYDSAYLDAK